MNLQCFLHKLCTQCKHWGDQLSLKKSVKVSGWRKVKRPVYQIRSACEYGNGQAIGKVIRRHVFQILKFYIYLDDGLNLYFLHFFWLGLSDPTSFKLFQSGRTVPFIVSQQGWINEGGRSEARQGWEPASRDGAHQRGWPVSDCSAAASPPGPEVTLLIKKLRSINLLFSCMFCIEHKTAHGWRGKNHHAMLCTSLRWIGKY